MVAADRGDKPRQGKRQGQASKGPDPPSPGNAMSAKTRHKRRNDKKSKTGPPPAYAASTISMATQNVINMGVVFAVSGTILLGLLAAKHF
jgi:hypothetical protein